MKPILWQVTFDAITLHAIRIHYENGRRPKRVETMKPCRVLFDVSFDGHKILMDEVCYVFVAV